MAMMTNHPLLALIATGALLSGCAGKTVPATAAARAPAWQTVIRDADRKRLAGLWSAWTRSLAEVQGAGQMSRVGALGAIAVPDAAREAPPPGPGAYRCRSVKMGNREDGSIRGATPPVIADDFRPCTITARKGLLYFDQGRGDQRVAGTLYPDGDRQVFLGSLALPGESGIMAYGTDGDRDQVGVLRAFGDERWRLELPWPMWQSNLQVIEIVPA